MKKRRAGGVPKRRVERGARPISLNESSVIIPDRMESRCDETTPKPHARELELWSCCEDQIDSPNQRARWSEAPGVSSVGER